MRLTETLLTTIPKYCPHCGFRVRGYFDEPHSASITELVSCIIAVCIIGGIVIWWNYMIDKKYLK